VMVDGALPSDASVELVPLDIDHAVRTVAVTAEGTFTVEGVPHGAWRVEPRAAGYVALAEEVVRVHGPEAATVVRMQRTGEVRGVVVDARGTPVPNATVVLRDAGRGGMTHAFSLAPSATRWVHPLASARLLPLSAGQRFGASRPGTRPAECGRGHCGVDLASQRGSIVHAVADGQITVVRMDSGGESGRLVAIDHGGRITSMYMHLDDIRGDLEVGQRVRAGDPLGTLGMTGIKFSAPHLHFAITYESRGRTWYLDPEPMLRHAVVLGAPRSLEDGEPTTRAAPASGPAIAEELATDDRGMFRVDNVAPGSYIAVAYAPGLAPGTSAAFTVTSGEPTAGLSIRLQPGVIVHGRVVGRGGPIAGAHVVAGGGTGESAHKLATTTTDRNGEFVLRALAGTVSLTASASRYTHVERTVSLGGRDRRREDFVLTAEDAVLRGQVIAPDGGAASGVSVRVVEGISKKRTLTDAQGQFTIDPVAVGRYVLEIGGGSFPVKRATVDVDRWAELRLDAGGRVQALVRDAHTGSGLANIRVEARGPGGARATRSTDTRGLVDLRGLAAGEWKLAARAPGYAPATRLFRVRASGVEDVTLELSRSATIAGVVRDGRGQRVGGAQLRIGGQETRADDLGNFELHDVPVGHVEVEAERDGLRGVLPLRLAPGDVRTSLTIELR
jgi:murein DD-endopeptidase MepM/ murein hydrolase activator NlpD